jgi:hypothetical protein
MAQDNKEIEVTRAGLLRMQGQVHALQILVISLMSTHPDKRMAANLARHMAETTRDSWLGVAISDALIESFDSHMTALLPALDA